MEIRCSQCQHLGPAADVRPSENGVVLVCANCGYLNPLEVSGGAPPGSAAKPAPPLIRARVAPAEVSAESEWIKIGALERLLPEIGEGPRCRKCAHLLDHEDEFCPRCGLSVQEGSRYIEGGAPWERPPEGREAQYEQATLLWKAVAENPTDDNLTKFAEFTREEDLTEYGIRQMRAFLVLHPGNERATRHLEELAQTFQSKMILAQAQAAMRAGNFAESAGRAKGLLLWVVFAVWTGVLVLFLTQLGGSGC